MCPTDGIQMTFFVSTMKTSSTLLHNLICSRFIWHISCCRQLYSRWIGRATHNLVLPQHCLGEPIECGDVGKTEIHMHGYVQGKILGQHWLESSKGS